MRVLQKALATLLLPLLLSAAAPAFAEDEDTAPPVVRLSLVQGEVSFWRPGAEDWAVARLNTPLAAGDTLHTGANAAIELQVDDNAFIRAAAGTHLDVLALEADTLRLRVEEGRVAFDLPRWEPGLMLEVESPDGVFRIERAGYYRMAVNGDTRLIVRDGGYVSLLTPGTGEEVSVYSAEAVIAATRDRASPRVTAAPALDDWDRWNQARTDDLTTAASARHLPPGVAGARELDQYGAWREEPDYGPIWVPRDVPPGWAPYSTGGWIRDPYYEWTWVDDAPWGWAPFHYGRWVYIDSFWGWAPGPRVTHPRRTPYSPALVGFYGASPGLSIHLGVNTPGLSWVALSWGEPLIPWWHRHHAFGLPWWGGWYGPRVVNQVVIKQTTVIDIRHIRHHNKRVANAIVAMPREHFGHRQARPVRVKSEWAATLEPVRGALPVRSAGARQASPARDGPRPSATVGGREWQERDASFRRSLESNRLDSRRIERIPSAGVTQVQPNTVQPDTGRLARPPTRDQRAPQVEPNRRGAVTGGPSPATVTRVAPPPTLPDARTRPDEQARPDAPTPRNARTPRDVPMGRDVRMQRDVPMQPDARMQRDLRMQPVERAATQRQVAPPRQPFTSRTESGRASSPVVPNTMRAVPPWPSVLPVPSAGAQAREQGTRGPGRTQQISPRPRDREAR